MPRLCFVVAQAWGAGEGAGELRPHAQLSYLEEGIPADMMNGEEAYFLIALKGALMHVVAMGKGERG